MSVTPTYTNTLTDLFFDPDACRGFSWSCAIEIAGIIPYGKVAKLGKPATTLANTTDRLSNTADTAHDIHKSTNTADDVLTFGSKAAAREGLPGDASAAASRFFRDATSKSVDFQAQALPGGGYRLQFFSPANNPGYGKLYGQEIDAAGNVINEFKNTIGPDGLIETKWIHGGP